MVVSLQNHLAVKKEIQARAQGLGFDDIRFADACALPENAARLGEFLTAGHHGEMVWMADRMAWRSDPQSMWPAARSVIVLGLNYGPKDDPLAILKRKYRGAISVYAQGEDYHDVVKKKLKALAGHIFRAHGADVKVFVDTAPVMEKAARAKSRIGLAGKTHEPCLATVWFLALFGQHLHHPGTRPRRPRKKIIVAIATLAWTSVPRTPFPHPIVWMRGAAFPISQSRIKGLSRVEFRAAMGNRIYGCDDCLAVCPWNKFASAASEIRLAAREDLKAPSLETLAELDDVGFRRLFRKSPVKRIGRDRFVRNVMVAIGNSNDPALAGRARAALEDVSALVRGAAVWALSQLLPRDEFLSLAKTRYANEADANVRAEWIRD
jgi:epoxyqueuosine reductase